MTWTIKLGRRERLILERCMGRNGDQVDGAEASAVIVGEAPGPRSSANCPMFPYPPHSSGGRLLAIADMDPVEYLRRFARTDLLDAWPGVDTWGSTHKAAAHARAAEITGKVQGMTLILLGRKVVDSFGPFAIEIPLFGSRYLSVTGGGITVVRMPHPSGRANGYSGREERAKARALLRSAAVQSLPPCPACAAVGLHWGLPLRFDCACGAAISFRRQADTSVTVQVLEGAA